MEMKVYAIKHKDERIREASRSGGFFTALSDWFLNHKGVVYGCVLTEKYEAKHIRCIDKNVRNLMRGSKYIQSSMGNCFELVKKDLDECKNVLFTGTSCQIDGLKHYLQREYDNLFCLDIVCHGVPSKKVWIEYLKWLSKDDLGSISSVDFRNKVDFGWHTHVETITFKDGSKINSEVFQRLFYGHAVLRPSCYVCPYKNVFHPGDITIADFWGIDKCKPEFDDNKGVSLVLVNTEKGLMYWDKIKDDYGREALRPYVDDLQEYLGHRVDLSVPHDKASRRLICTADPQRDAVQRGVDIGFPEYRRTGLRDLCVELPLLFGLPGHGQGPVSRTVAHIQILLLSVSVVYRCDRGESLDQAHDRRYILLLSTYHVTAHQDGVRADSGNVVNDLTVAASKHMAVQVRENGKAQ